VEEQEDSEERRQRELNHQMNEFEKENNKIL
jgi:hypothetical protein